MRAPVSPPPRSILVACIRLIGDVILSTPLVGLLKSAYPETEIDYLVNRGTGEFLEKDPRIRRVLYTRNREARKPVGSPEPGYFRKIFGRYDMAITLNASDRGGGGTGASKKRSPPVPEAFLTMGESGGRGGRAQRTPPEIPRRPTL